MSADAGVAKHVRRRRDRSSIDPNAGHCRSLAVVPMQVVTAVEDARNETRGSFSPETPWLWIEMFLNADRVV